MPVIDHLDTTTKRIYLAVGVRSYHPVEDIYREVRALRRTTEALRRFKLPVSAAGNVSKGGGRFTPRYAVLREGWRVVPEDVSHTLAITGEQLTAEGGAGPACMDLTLLSATSKVIVQYEPPAAEVITVNTGGTVAPTQQQIRDALALASGASPAAGSVDDLLLALYRLAGLDPTRPLVVNQTARTAGAGITQTISRSNGQTTITRDT